MPLGDKLLSNSHNPYIHSAVQLHYMITFWLSKKIPFSHTKVDWFLEVKSFIAFCSFYFFIFSWECMTKSSSNIFELCWNHIWLFYIKWLCERLLFCKSGHIILPSGYGYFFCRSSQFSDLYYWNYMHTRSKDCGKFQ